MSIQKAHRDFREAEESIKLTKWERKELYINAAKGYFAVAKKIDDKATRASLLYLSVLAAHKAEFFSSSHVPNKNNVDDDSKESTKLISSTAGRMNTFQSPETLYEGSTRRDIERGSRPSGHEVVADLLVLEARLADLGLMKTGVRRIVEEEPSSSTLSALLSESFVAPLKTRVYRSSSPPTDVIENRSSSSGKLDTVDQSTSPSTPTIGIKLQWPFGSLPWGQVPIESPSPLPLPSVNANLKNAEPLLSLDSMKTAHDNCNKENVNNDEYGKSSLNDLDTMQSGPSDASRHAAVSATITDSIRQLLLEASVSDSSASTSSPGTVQRSKLVLPQNEVFMSEGVLRLLKSVEKLSEENTTLLQRLRDLSTVEQQNFTLRKEVDNFKQDYSQKFARLKQSLREFADKHPIDENPAHAFLGNQQYVSNKQAGAVVPDMPILSHTDEQNALRQVQLEKTVKGLLSRLETANQHLAQAKAEAEKKGRLVIKYENYYRELKRSVEKREQERLLACGGVDIGTSEKPTEEPSVLESETPDNTNEKITDTTLPQKTLMLAKPSTQDALPLSPLFGASAVMNLPRSKHPTTSTLEASLQRTAALEKKDRKK